MGGKAFLPSLYMNSRGKENIRYEGDVNHINQNKMHNFNFYGLVVSFKENIMSF